MRRLLVCAVAVSVLVSGLVTGTGSPPASGVAGGADPTRTRASAPAPTAADEACRVQLLAATPGAREGVVHTVTAAAPPTATTWATDTSNLTGTDVVAIGTYGAAYGGGVIASDSYWATTATRGGRLRAHHRNVASDTDSGWSTGLLARGLPPVRALAEGSAGASYTLDGGTLRRYTTTSTTGGSVVRASGSVRGYSTYRGLTLLRSGRGHDVLVATTTRGALMAITVPHTRAFTPRVATLRAATWQVFDRLVAAPCGSGSALVGVDTRTGRSQVYTVGPIATRPAATSIRRWGPLPHPITGSLVAPVISVDKLAVENTG